MTQQITRLLKSKLSNSKGIKKEQFFLDLYTQTALTVLCSKYLSNMKYMFIKLGSSDHFGGLFMTGEMKYDNFFKIL